MGTQTLQVGRGFTVKRKAVALVGSEMFEQLNYAANIRWPPEHFQSIKVQ